MHQGKIAEMQTDEGKTLAAVFPVYLHALTGKGVHVLTFNDYLARQDTRWMGPAYEFLGLKTLARWTTGGNRSKENRSNSKDYRRPTPGHKESPSR